MRALVPSHCRFEILGHPPALLITHAQIEQRVHVSERCARAVPYDCLKKEKVLPQNKKALRARCTI